MAATHRTQVRILPGSLWRIAREVMGTTANGRPSRERRGRAIRSSSAILEGPTDWCRSPSRKRSGASRRGSTPLPSAICLMSYVSRFRCRGVAQPGRALALGASSRRFKSYRLDQPGRTSRWATAPAWKPGGASCRGSTPLPSAIIGRTSRCDDGTRFENGRA